MPDIAPVPAANTSMLPQEDRLLAAISHLSFFTGFWLVAPIAVYIAKRKESRFVAFHALQAVLLQVLFGAISIVGALVFVVLGVIAGLIHSPALVAVVTIVPLLAFALGCLGLCTMHAVAAYAAWQGRTWTIPIAGRIAGGILGADEGAAKA